MEITKQLRPTTTLAREHAGMPASRKRTRQEADNDDDDTIYGTSKNEMVLSSSSSSLFNNATPPSTNTCFSNQWNDTLPMTAEQEAQVLHDFFTLPLPESSLSCPSSPPLFGGGGIEYSATPNPAVGNFGLVSPSPTLATLEKKDAVKEDQARDCQVEKEENVHTVSPQNDAPRSCTIVVGETQVVLPPFSISTLQQNLKASSNPALLRLACMIEYYSLLETLESTQPVIMCWVRDFFSSFYLPPNEIPILDWRSILLYQDDCHRRVLDIVQSAHAKLGKDEQQFTLSGLDTFKKEFELRNALYSRIEAQFSQDAVLKEKILEFFLGTYGGMFASQPLDLPPNVETVFSFDAMPENPIAWFYQEEIFQPHVPRLRTIIETYFSVLSAAFPLADISTEEIPFQECQEQQQQQPQQYDMNTVSGCATQPTVCDILACGSVVCTQEHTPTQTKKSNSMVGAKAPGRPRKLAANNSSSSNSNDFTPACTSSTLPSNSNNHTPGLGANLHGKIRSQTYNFPTAPIMNFFSRYHDTPMTNQLSALEFFNVSVTGCYTPQMNAITNSCDAYTKFHTHYQKARAAAETTLANVLSISAPLAACVQEQDFFGHKGNPANPLTGIIAKCLFSSLPSFSNPEEEELAIEWLVKQCITLEDIETRPFSCTKHGEHASNNTLEGFPNNSYCNILALYCDHVYESSASHHELPPKIPADQLVHAVFKYVTAMPKEELDAFGSETWHDFLRSCLVPPTQSLSSYSSSFLTSNNNKTSLPPTCLWSLPFSVCNYDGLCLDCLRRQAVCPPTFPKSSHAGKSMTMDLSTCFPSLVSAKLFESFTNSHCVFPDMPREKDGLIKDWTAVFFMVCQYLCNKISDHTNSAFQHKGQQYARPNTILVVFETREQALFFTSFFRMPNIFPAAVSVYESIPAYQTAYLMAYAGKSTLFSNNPLRGHLICSTMEEYSYQRTILRGQALFLDLYALFLVTPFQSPDVEEIVTRSQKLHTLVHFVWTSSAIGCHNDKEEERGKKGRNHALKKQDKTRLREILFACICDECSTTTTTTTTNTSTRVSAVLDKIDQHLPEIKTLCRKKTSSSHNGGPRK